MWDPHDGWVEGIPSVEHLRIAQGENEAIIASERHGADAATEPRYVPAADGTRPASTRQPRLIAMFVGGTKP